MSNSTRLALRTALRTLLNEQNANDSFWTDADLNEHLTNAYQEYYGQWRDMKGDDCIRSVEITYTAGLSGYNITPEDVERILSVEDRTDVASTDPGRQLNEATSARDLLKIREQGQGKPTDYFYNRGESIATGVVTRTNNIALAPVPSSTRTISIIFQSSSQLLSGDTYTTGLPYSAEKCVLMHAGELARAQEENDAGVARFSGLLEKAEQKMSEDAMKYNRGPDRIEFYDDDE